MKFIAINTAGSCIEAAAVNGDAVFFQREEKYLKASETLLPLLDGLLDKAQLQLKDVDFISVVIGAGSFTGIRIGVSSVRAFGYALNKKIVSINQNELYAYNSMTAAAKGFESVLSAVDAGNGFCYAAAYDGSMHELLPPKVMTIEQLKILKDDIDEPLITAFDFTVASALGECETVGEGLVRLSREKYLSGSALDYNFIEPLYIRKPQAEQE